MARHRLLLLNFGCSISTLWDDLFASLVPFSSEHSIRYMLALYNEVAQLVWSCSRFNLSSAVFSMQPTWKVGHCSWTPIPLVMLSSHLQWRASAQPAMVTKLLLPCSYEKKNEKMRQLKYREITSCSNTTALVSKHFCLLRHLTLMSYCFWGNEQSSARVKRVEKSWS